MTSSVAQCFSRAHHTYDTAATLQKQVGDELLSLFSCRLLANELIADVGGGTGLLYADLKNKFSDADLVLFDICFSFLLQAKRKYIQNCVSADFDCLPIASDQIALLYSNMALQWSPSLYPTFSELYRVLKPGGTMCFSMPVAGTLNELYSCLGVPCQQFYSEESVRVAASRAGFSITSGCVKKIILRYDSVRDLLSFLKDTGAVYKRDQSSAFFLNRFRLNQLVKQYEELRRDRKKLPASFVIYYGVLKKDHDN